MKTTGGTASLGMAFLLMAWGQTWGQQGGLVPVNPQPRTDKMGNEWYVEQNGMISRQGGGNSILSGSMMLMVGAEQFYCNQPMGTPDGRELVLMGQQPMQGLQVTRYIRLLEKEGGLRYLEVFSNPTGREIVTNLEIRHNFSGQVKNVVTDAGRPNTGTFEKGESGIAIVPGSTNYKGYLFTPCGPRSSAKPRIAAQNQYQLSFYYPLTVPPGKSVSVMHTVTQAKLAQKPEAADLEKFFRPFALARHTRDLPKGTSVTLVNVRASGAGGGDLSAWFPDELLGIRREGVDVLAMGEGTRLRGRATCGRLSLQHHLGRVNIPWEQVVALTGGRHEGRESRLYLADGQVLRGILEVEELNFALSSGLQMKLKVEDVDRLVMASSPGRATWPKGVAALVETWAGERWALNDRKDQRLTLATTWGVRQVELSTLSSLIPGADEGAPPLVTFKDGSRLRVWLGGQGEVAFLTPCFGEQRLPGVQIRALAVAATESGAGGTSEGEDNEEGEPGTSFADLAGDQRLVARPADAVWQVSTTGGGVPLDPGGIREMRNVTEEVSAGGMDEGDWFQFDLWGGGTVMGQMRSSTLAFDVEGSTWHVPVREIVRVVNPVPKISEGTLARIGQLIRALGDEEWKAREKASAELRTLGEMARGSLQEAYKQAEDPEVKRRLETILGELE